MPKEDQKALREIFVNNSEQLIKDAKAILRKQKKGKK